MQVTKIHSWDEFDSVARELDGWAFRGHRDANWQLLSSISRHLRNFVPDRGCWEERESRAIRIFRRKAHNYITDYRILDNDVRCLALMQHHGAPTRLLDFTKSPYVAAFFALERAIGTAAIYAVNTPILWSAAPISFPDLFREKIDPCQHSNFEKYFGPNKYDLVWTGEPTEMDRRLVAQSGTIIMPGVLDQPVEEILMKQYSSSEPIIKKLVFEGKELRDECLRSLYRMNITNATLFPDLEGLAKSTAFELEIIWKGLSDSRYP